MNILVLGGTGHTGERVVRRLLSAGANVRILSRRPPNNPILAPLLALGAQHAPGDANQPGPLTEAATGTQAIVSCAHIRHAESLVVAARAAAVPRIIQMSSTRRYTRFPCISSEEVIAGENALQASKLDWTILRATMIFGGRRDANLTRLVQWFQKHHWFPLPDAGRCLVQPLYTEDLAAAIVLATLQPHRATRRAFTLAGPTPLPIREMIRLTAHAVRGADPWLPPIPVAVALPIVRLLPQAIQKRTLTAEQIQRFLEDKTADITEARDHLDFNPLPFHEAIRLKVEGKVEIESLYPL